MSQQNTLQTVRFELTEELQLSLIQAAGDAMASAYCPYSNFPVGAAILASDGTIYKGCNVENASYGLTICAERNAIFSAVGEGRIEFSAIAVMTNCKIPARPCGACRQVIAEFSSADQPILIITANIHGDIALDTISNLLPDTFSLI